MSQRNSNHNHKDEPRVVHHLVDLISEKQKQEGRIIPKSEIVRESGVSHMTINRWLDGQFPDYDVERKLCLYFGIDIGDLLAIEQPEPEGTLAKDEAHSVIME
jgi:transcriptional regulator with XRE-family HTH domain